MEGNPFADLIPQQSNQSSSGMSDNPFADLIPEAQQQAPAPEQSFLQKANAAAQKYVVDPVDAIKSGLGRALTDVHNFAYAPADYLYGTKFVENRNREQAQADKAFDERFQGGSGAELLRFLGREVPEFGGGFKLGKAALEGTRLAGRKLLTPMAENAAAGAAVQQLQNPTDPFASLEGGAYGATAGALGRGLEKFAIQPAAKWYAESSIPGLIERATKMIKGGKSPEEGAAILKGAYDQAAAKNTANWENTRQIAKGIDESLQGIREVEKPSAILDAMGKPLLTKGKEAYSKFDSSPYQEFIDNYLKGIKNKTPAQQESYKEAARFAKSAKKLAPQSFEDAVTLRQNFNEHLNNFLRKNKIDSADRRTKSLVANLKENLIDRTVPANAKNINAESFGSFQKAWQDANRSHESLMKMHEGVAKAGNIKPKQVLREGLKQGAMPDPAILSEYLPKTGQTGIGGFKQLEKAVGNKKTAQEILRSYYFRKPLQDSTTKQTVADIYGKLSPTQREYIFGGSKEKDLLNAVDKARLAFPKKEGENRLLHHGMFYSVPALAGTSALYATGEMPLHEAFLYGGIPAMIAAKGARGAVGKYATPSSVLKAINRAEKSGKRQGRLLNVGLQQLGTGGQQ